MLGFFVMCYLVCKMYENKKTKNRNNEYIVQFIDTMHCRVIQVILKLFCLKFGAYSFAQFLYCN